MIRERGLQIFGILRALSLAIGFTGMISQPAAHCTKALIAL